MTHDNAYGRITLEELSTRIGGERAPLLFEVLGEAYYAAGHLPGAAVMPLDRVASIARDLAPDRGSEVVLYCASVTCMNSHVAATKLVELGYANVRVFAGGKAAWQEAGLPLVKSAA